MSPRQASSPPLAISGTDLAGMLSTVTALVTRFLDDMPRGPAFDDADQASFMADPSVRQAPGEAGRSLVELLNIVDRAGRIGVNVIAGNSLAYIPGSGLPTSAIADLISGIFNPYTGVGFAAPAMVALEHDVIRWLVDTMGLPKQAGGLLTTGGSMATLSAIACARERHFADKDFSAARIYLTEQAHHCVAKGAQIAGFQQSALRLIPTDRHLRMDIDALSATIRADRDEGLQPFCVVANAGTTNTGAIDPLEAIAAIAQEENLWLHVDGAYGGFFRLTERGRERLRGIEHADSVVLDPHKSMFLPFGTGCLLVRDQGALRRGHGAQQSHYMRDLGDDRPDDFATLGPELTRPNRGLRIWLSLHLHGVAAFRAALDEKLDLAAKAHQALLDVPFVQAFGEPELSIACFHCALPQATLEEENRATEDLVRLVNDRRNVLLSTTDIAGRVVARMAVLSLRTSAETIDRAIADISIAATLIATCSGSGARDVRSGYA
jgi:aromatic-L-amino-acid decarboxylase